MKQNLMYIILGVLLVFISCKEEKEGHQMNQEEVIPVRTMPVQRETLESVYNTSGFFTTDDETPLSFKNGGLIEKINVREGDQVKAGEVLATVKGTETKAATEQAEENYRKTKRDYERAANLYKDSVGTLKDMQDAKTAFEIAKQDKASAQFNAEQTDIRALQDGTVLEKFLREGQMAGPGTPVLLVGSGGEGQWIFKTNVTDEQWAALQIGDSAVVRTDIDKKKKTKAQVLQKTAGIDQESGGFTIQLALEQTDDLSLATGLFGKATLYSSQKTEGWQIPYEALLDGDSGQAFVFVTEDGKTAKKIKVHVSQVTHGNVLIDEGLEDAQEVIVSGNAYLTDGSKITNNSEKE